MTPTGILPKEKWIEKRLNEVSATIKAMEKAGEKIPKDLFEEEELLAIQFKTAVRIGAFNMELLKSGKPLKRGQWDGYWMYDADKDTIIIHCKDGQLVDIRETEDLEFTINNILAKNWEIATATNCKMLRKEQPLCK